MGFTFDDFIRLAKKAFKFWQSTQKKQQQQQQQGGQYSNNQNPYPQQGQQQQQNAWQQPHGQQQQQHYQGGAGGQASSHGYGGGGGGYGAHDGPATVRVLSTRSDRERVRYRRVDGDGGRLPFEVMRLLQARLYELEYRLSVGAGGLKIGTGPRYHQLQVRIDHQTRRRLTCSSSLSSPRSLLPYFVPPTSSAPTSSPLSFLSHLRTFSSLPPRHIRPLPRFLLPRPPPRPRLYPAGLSPIEYTLWILEQQQNQDMANAQNQNYVDLRNKAIKEGDLMGKAFAASKQAYSSGNGAQAHQLSEEGKQHQRMKEQYNNQAAQWIYNENNRNSPPGTFDLHGMYVAESITFADRAIASARQSGMSEIRLIVGKGNHSPQHIAKVKPAIEELMQREKLSASLDPRNSGVLVVHLDGRQGGGSREIMDGLEKDPGTDCVIM